MKTPIPKAIVRCFWVTLLILGACTQPSAPPAQGGEPARMAPGSSSAGDVLASHSESQTSGRGSAAGEPKPNASTTAATLAPVASAPQQPARETVPVPSSPCPADMVDVEVACIDRYEAPNEAGKQPLVMLNQSEAEVFCTERGKRLCTEDEWVRACKGPKGWLYPYGPKYDEHACNQDKKHIPPSWKKLGRWPAPESAAEVSRLNQAEPSGQRATCGSAEGVFDLTGNVGEWVVRVHPHPEACTNEEQQSHRYVVMGCFWGKCFRPPHLPTCEYVNCAHASGFHSYEFGARCCQDRAGE